MVPTKSPGNWQPFGDYQALNIITVTNQYDLRNATQTFQHFMNQILHSLPFNYAYLNNILVTSKNLDEHLCHLQKVFSCLRGHAIQINATSCVLGAVSPGVSWTSNGLTGHSSSGIQSPVDQVVPQCDFPNVSSSCPCELCQLLGLVNFYHLFVPGSVSRLPPHHDLLSQFPMTPLSLDTEGYPCLQSHQGCRGRGLPPAAVRYTHPQRYAQHKTHISMDLSKCIHVFVRRDVVRRSLQPLYNGSFKLHQSSPKFFTNVGNNSKHQTISFDHLKPADLDIPGASLSPALLSLQHTSHHPL